MYMESTKDSLVTYNFEASDSESNNEKENALNSNESEGRSMEISPATVDSILQPSMENTPSDQKVTQKHKIKSKTSGLVSYGMDDDDSDDDSGSYISDTNISNDNDSEGYKGPTEKSGIDQDERFDPDILQDSDMDVDSGPHDDTNSGGKDSVGDKNSQATAEDLKRNCGKSSLATNSVSFERPRPQDPELVYALSRQIHKTGVVELPPSLPFKASQEIEQRLDEMRSRVKNAPESVSKILHNKEYRNPSIYEKLIQHLKIDERGTNYPPELYDPYRFNEESYYDNLARAQEEAEKQRKVDQDKKESAGGKTQKVSKSISDTKVRLTKWDSGTSKTASSTKTYMSNSSLLIETKTVYPLNK